MGRATPAGRRPQRPAPSRGSLGPEAIVAAARELVAEAGLEAVSMRLLAERLRCTPRALYRHVASKDELLELLADAVLADVPEARPGRPWQEELAAFFVAMRAHLVAEPSLTRLVAERTVSGPHFRRHFDRLATLLLDAGFDDATAVDLVLAMAYYTIGASLPGTGDAIQARYAAGWDAALDESVPALRRVAPALAHGPAEARFRTALDRMLAAYAR